MNKMSIIITLNSLLLTLTQRITIRNQNLLCSTLHSWFISFDPIAIYHYIVFSEEKLKLTCMSFCVKKGLLTSITFFIFQRLIEIWICPKPIVKFSFNSIGGLIKIKTPKLGVRPNLCGRLNLTKAFNSSGGINNLTLS